MDLDGFHQEPWWQNSNRSSQGDNRGSGDGVWYSSTDASSTYNRQRRRFQQHSGVNVFLGPAFNACAGAGAGAGSSISSSVDVDPSLLRYTSPQVFFSPISNSQDERALQQLIQSQHLRRPPDFFSPPPLRPVPRTRTPPIRPILSSPLRGAVMEDGVLVINDEFVDEDDLMVRMTAGRHPYLDSYLFGGTNSRNNVRRSGGTGFFLSRTGTRRYRSFEGGRHARDGYQTGRRPNFHQSRQVTRNPDLAPPQATATATASPSLPVMPRAEEHVNRRRGAVDGAPPSGTTSTLTCSSREPMTVPPVPLVRIPRPSSTSTFVWPPTEEENAEMERVLCGPRRWRRLPVFNQICPEE